MTNVCRERYYTHKLSRYSAFFGSELMVSIVSNLTLNFGVIPKDLMTSLVKGSERVTSIVWVVIFGIFLICEAFNHHTMLNFKQQLQNWQTMAGGPKWKWAWRWRGCCWSPSASVNCEVDVNDVGGVKTASSAAPSTIYQTVAIYARRRRKAG